ncbi:MAG: hypothetical protein AAF585_12330 [Verrucomicrobiota bacterium]
MKARNLIGFGVPGLLLVFCIIGAIRSANYVEHFVIQTERTIFAIGASDGRAGFGIGSEPAPEFDIYFESYEGGGFAWLPDVGDRNGSGFHFVIPWWMWSLIPTAWLIFFGIQRRKARTAAAT